MGKRILTAALWLAISAVPIAPGSAWADEQESLERALVHLEKGDAASAVIELKNAIQENPNNAESRALLGEVYLRAGDAASAAKELQRARELGRTDQPVRLMLAEALLQIGEYQQIVDEITADQPISDEIGAGLLAVRGQALFGLGRFDEARTTLEKVAAGRPVASAYAGLARMALFQGDLTGATRYLDAGLAQFPDNVALRLLRGEQQMQTLDFEAARRTYEALSADQPNNMGAGVGLARAELALGRVEPARVVIDDLLEKQPKSLALLLLRSVAELQARDYKAAREDAHLVLTFESANPAALYVSGAASYGLGEYEQALDDLQHYVALAPNDPAGRKLLAATHMRMGNASAAHRTLGDDPQAAKDPEYLALLGATSAMSGDMPTGLRLFEQAVMQSPTDARLRAQLGLMRIAAGDATRGAAELEQAIAIDPSLANDPRYDRAEIALIQGYLGEGKFDEALEAIRAWQTKHPKDATGLVMEGVALAAKGDVPAGREAFLRALELKPGAPDASANLAILDLRDNDPASAERRLTEVLKHHPGDLRTLLLLAQMSEQAGDRSKTRDYLEQSVAAHPSSLEARLFLARLYYELKEPEKALSTIAPALQQAPDNVPALEVKARSELATGNAAAAIATYQTIVRAAPDTAQPRFELSQAHAATGALAEARQAAEAALAIDPDHAPARFQLARLNLALGDADAAEAAIAALAQSHPDAVEIKELRGDLLMLRNQPKEAVAQYQAARAQGPDTSRLAIAEARAQATGGNVAAATKTLESWIAANPADTPARLELNRYYQRQGRMEDAEANLRIIVGYEPDSWIARNDLAWMLYERRDLKAALPHAERAAELAGDNPAILDTLGVILLEMGETERALSLLRRANEGLPDNPEIGFHLAQAYARADRRNEARQLLSSILGKHGKFNGRDAAEALLAQLGG